MSTHAWDFLFTADTDSELFEYRTGRLPPGSWIDNDLVLYPWRCRAVRFNTAIRRAVTRLRNLRERTGIHWDIDDDVHRGEEIIYIGEHPLVDGAMKDSAA